MSNTIDRRVVEMQFDNAAFEKGVQETTKSLANLDKTIDSVAGTSSNGKLSSALSAVTTKLKNIIPADSITAAASGVAHTIGSIFSQTADAVSTVSKIGLGSITAMGAAVTALAATGGMRRALNIEQAKFQLEGLGVAWEQIYDDLDYAVTGTAYGLDSAAKAASQLVASGIEVGDSMKTALRGISGVSAMTNREYDEVAHIFTTVAGNGRLMGMQLTQLSSYGLNVAATLAKSEAVISQFGELTEADIRELVSQGKIDFATFAQAMDETFGQHAKDANNTFTGSMANTKAALSRIGAEFATPYMENMKDVFNALIPFINMIKKSMTPIFSEFSSVMEKGKTAIAQFLEPFTGLVDVETELGTIDVVDRTASSILFLKTTFSQLIDIAHTVGSAFGEAFGAMAEGLSTYWGLDKLPKGYVLLSKIMQSVTDFNNNVIKRMDFGRFFEAALGPIWVEGMQIKQVFDTIAKSFSGFDLASTFNGFVDVFAVFMGLVEDALTIWNNFIMAGIEMAAPVITDLGNVFHDFAMAFSDFINQGQEYAPIVDTILGFIETAKNGFLDFYNSIRGSLPTFDTFTAIFETIGNVFTILTGPASALVNYFHDLIESISGSAVSDISSFAEGIKAVGDVFMTFLDKSGLLSVFNQVLDSIKNVMETLSHTTFSDILGAFAGGVLIQQFIVVRNLLDTIKGGVKDISKFNAINFANLMGFGPAVTQVKNAFLVLQGTLNAKMIAEIAKSLLIIAGALFVLSLVPFHKLITGGAALTYMAVVLSWVFNTIYHLPPSGGDTFGFTRQIALLTTIAGSLLVLAVAMKLLSSIGLEGMLSAAIGMLLSVASLVALVIVIGAMPSRALSKGAGVILALGIAFINLALAMKILGTIKGDSLASALISIAALTGVIAALMVSIGYISNAKSIAASAALFATIGGAILLMAASVKLLSTMDANQAMTGILAMAAIVTAISAMMLVIKGIHYSSLLGAMGAFATMGVAFLSLAITLKALSTISDTGMVTAIGGLAASLLVLVGAIAVLSGLGAKAAAGVTSLLLMSAALLLLAPALLIISNIPMPGIAAILITLATTLGLLALAAVLIPAPALLAIAAAIAAIGVSVLAVGAGIGVATLGIAAFITAIAALIQVIGQFAGSFAELALKFGEAAGQFIIGLVTAIGDARAKLIEAGVSMGRGFLAAIGAIVPDVVALGLAVVVGFLEGVASNIGTVVSYGLEIITNLILGIASGIGDLISAGFQLVIMFIMGIADAFRTNRKMLENAILDVMNTIGMAFLEGLAGIVQGIPIFGDDMAKELRDQAAKMEASADEASEAVRKEFDEKNSDILTGTSQTMDEAGNIISNAEKPLSEASSSTGSVTAKGFLDSLGVQIPDALSTNFKLSSDTIQTWAPQLAQITGMSAEDIVEAFEVYSAPLPDVAEDVSQEAADNMEAVDYETPGEDNATEYAEGIDNDAYKAEDSASAMAENAADSAEGEAWRGEGAGNSLSDNYSSGIDTHAGDDDGYWIVANTIAEMEGQDYRAENVGENLVQGLINGMQKLADDVYTLANNIASGAAYAMEVGAVVQSPSKLTTRTGRYITMGLIKGMESLENESVSAAEGIGRNTALAMNGFASLVDAIDWDANPTITPVLDTSLVESGLQAMDGFFSDSQTRQAGWAAGNYTIGAIPVSNNQNGNTNNVTVMLNYDASADANELVMGIARALRTNVLMEG